MSTVIKNVICSKKDGKTIFIFRLSALDLKRFGKISRLHEKDGGVQRRLDEDRATRIALAMKDSQVEWLDTILVHMEPESSWIFQEGCITTKEGFSLSIDDGQHRRYALEVLSDEELEALGEFTVTATHGLTFEERLKLFLQQEKRKHIHANVILKGRDLLGDWRNENEKTAYDIVKALNEDGRSPLKGLIVMEEKVKSADSSDDASGNILAKGLFSTLKAVLGHRGLLKGMEPNCQKDIVIRLLAVAANRVWKDEWSEPKEFITSSSRGVNAILRLLVSGITIREVLDDNDFGDPRLYTALILASKYNWSVKYNTQLDNEVIVKRIDNLMSRRRSELKKRRERDRQN
jgi:DGQHR domain-containing protein